MAQTWCDVKWHFTIPGSSFVPAPKVCHCMCVCVFMYMYVCMYVRVCTYSMYGANPEVDEALRQSVLAGL